MLAGLFTLFFVVVALISLTVADRMAPVDRGDGPEDMVLDRYHQVVGRRQSLVRVLVAVLFGLIVGIPAATHWESWLLFRNSKSFGINDAAFHKDVGFYVFKLPFLQFVVQWLFATFLIITLLTAVAHYVNGGIRLQPGARHVTSQVKLHLSALLAVLALLKAADYWLRRYSLTTSTRGFTEGLSYTEDHAQVPAYMLLILISLLSAVLLIVNVRQKGWRLPIISVGLWLVVAIVAGTIYPALVQRFQVEPAESTRERTYIDRSIKATRAAYGLDKVEEKNVSFDTTTASDVEAGEPQLRDVRLLDTTVSKKTFNAIQITKAGYSMPDLDVDRYDVEGAKQQVVIAVRELNPDTVPVRTWEGRHLAYTHGYGVAFAPAGQVDASGRPNFLVTDGKTAPKLSRPEVYVGDGLSSYAVVDTAREGGEESFAGENSHYSGTGGVKLDSHVRRAAFALDLGEYNLFGSRLITDQSQIIFHRDVRDRVHMVAPFLSLDADPYPVIRDDGTLVWVVDAYTTTSRYPYSESADTRSLAEGTGLDHSFNYVRNSVKAVVNAYTGEITLYIVDQTDPIAKAWESAFPKLFAQGDIPQDLRDHFRYPEDLFRVQTNLYGRYRVQDPNRFFDNKGAWNVAQAAPIDPTSTASSAAAAAAPTTTDAANASRRSSGLRQRPLRAVLLGLPVTHRRHAVVLAGAPVRPLLRGRPKSAAPSRDDGRWRSRATTAS